MDDNAKASRADFLQKRLKVLQEMDAVLAELATLGGAPSAPAIPVVSPAQIDKARWRNLPLSDAIVEYLGSVKEAKTPQAIWDGLAAAGCETEAQNPVDAVSWALKKLVAREGSNVVRIGWNKWHLRSKYTKRKLERLLAKGAGRGGHSLEDHRAATLEGMEKAKQRGKVAHRPSVMTLERVTKIKQLMESGCSNSAIAKEAGISLNTFYYYRPRIVAWNIGEPWPLSAEKPAEETEPSHIRLVKS